MPRHSPFQVTLTAQERQALEGQARQYSQVVGQAGGKLFGIERARQRQQLDHLAPGLRVDSLHGSRQVGEEALRQVVFFVQRKPGKLDAAFGLRWNAARW